MGKKGRVALQLVGFGAGVALLVWVIARAFATMTPDDWDRLRNASTGQLAGLVGLAALSVAMNGVLWWLAIRPVKRLRLGDTASVNAIATVLAYAPFKLSVVFRATYHRSVDGLAVLTFGGWAAAIAAGLLAGVVPALALRLTPLSSNLTLWIVASAVGAVVAAIVGSALSRSLATGAGWRFVRRSAFRLGGARGLRLVRGPMFTNLHAATHMLAQPGPVVAAALLRLIDALVLAGRFLIAASVLGVDVSAATAVVVGVAFFLIGALAPTGAAGVREGGAAGLLALLGVDESVTPIVVFVAATGVLGELGIGAMALAWLGPGRLRGLVKRREGASSGGETPGAA
ncbi:MAG: lysylphosphatidylglycerol synthase domain-containing protein [Planctomycetota bacterium]